jgi:hypothetical protein
MPYKAKKMQDIKVELVEGEDVEIDWIRFE